MHVSIRLRGGHKLLGMARVLLCTLVALALLTGCQPPTPTPTPTVEPHIFTVLTAQGVQTADPAVAIRDVDAIVGTNIYQRLMRVQPDTGELKPDLATDCIFTSRLVYECSLPPELTFHNGHSLTASDVRFSIQRALRLNTPDTGIALLKTLEKISVPDPLTVRFTLSYADGDFGFALATLAASIVDEEIFDPDVALPLEQLPIGSGPYQLSAVEEGKVFFDIFAEYVGPLKGDIPKLVLVEGDSVAAETAMMTGSVELIWRTLEDSALARLRVINSADQPPEHGYSLLPLAGTRVNRLYWNSNSKFRNKVELREGIAAALQTDRSLDSLVPVGVAGHVAAFELGGRPELPKLKSRVNLTLGYDPSAPGHADLARLLRDRMEQISSLSVRIVADANTDLYLSDHLPWVGNALGWLQSYLEYPLEESAEQLAALEFMYRSGQESADRSQTQAAKDLTVLPISQNDGILVTKNGVTLVGDAMGNGGQLGLWGIRND